VPRVLEKRAIAIFLTSWPITGISSLALSMSSFVAGSLYSILKSIMPNPINARPIYHLLFAKSLTTRSTFVITGSSTFISLNICRNLGTMNVIRKPRTDKAMVRTSAGYIIADLILPSNLWDFSANSASRVKTTSRTPPASPAFTVLTYNGSNAFGNFESASENELPPSTCSARPRMVAFNSPAFSCLSRTYSARTSGRPEPISVASCLVNIVTCFAVTLPNNEIVMTDFAGFTSADPPLSLEEVISDFDFSSVMLIGYKPFCRIWSIASWFPATSSLPLVSLPSLSIAT